MLRSILRAGLLSKRLNNVSSFRPVTRQFTSEIISEWPDEIKSFLKRENIHQPTKIQEMTLKHALSKKDVVGIARTGSGKTLAFVIPAAMTILENLKANPDGSRFTSCLVLEPTRELAEQTWSVFEKFRKFGITSRAIVGGASRDLQIRDLTDNTFDALIATPGRLNDLINSDLVDLSNVRYLVLDEADRMLDMGFEDQIRNIMSRLPDDKQTLMWSATWPPEIRDLAEDFLKDFEYVAVDGDTLKANPNIKQEFEFCQPHMKFELLLKHIDGINESFPNARYLVFVNTKVRADNLLIQLMRSKLRAVTMHGDKSQNQRNRALDLFKRQLCNIMVATDVAARGLDIKDITHVINYDMPTNVEDYVHRIGRTARFEQTGNSISFVTDTDNFDMRKKLAHLLKEMNQEVPKQLYYAPRQFDRAQYKTRQPYSRERLRNSDYSIFKNFA